MKGPVGDKPGRQNPPQTPRSLRGARSGDGDLACPDKMPPGIIIAVCSREPMPRCIVCNNPQMTRQASAGDFARFDCPRCGSFVLSEAAENTLERVFAEPVSVRRSLMSHTLRRMQRSDQKHLHKIISEELPTFWKDERLPTPLEQADNLILWIGDNQAAPAEWAETTVPAIAATIGIAVSREKAMMAGRLAGCSLSLTRRLCSEFRKAQATGCS
jgi:hypothetical protein